MTVTHNWINIKEKTWKDVRDRVSKIKPDLAKIIDEFNPPDSYTFFEVQYPFGSKILNNRQLMLPITEVQKCVPFNHPKATKIVGDKLNYSMTPLSLITDRSIEIYAEMQDRIVPFKIFTPGDIFGVWELINIPKTISIQRAWSWNISAGARSIFLLPKITDTLLHKQMNREIGIRSHVPNSLFDHWRVFADIAETQKVDWHVTLLIFTKKWVEPTDSAAWVKLYNYWLIEAWKQSLNWRNKITVDFAWEALGRVLNNRKLKPELYLLNTLKHLLEVGTGAIPGFIAAGLDDAVAPIKTIQDAYINLYGIKDYSPIIFHPSHLTPDRNINAVYYSLQTPTLVESPPNIKNPPSAMSELRELQELMDILMEVLRETPKIDKQMEYDMVECVKFDYFHHDVDKFGTLRLTKDMIREDQRLSLYPKEYGERIFPDTAYFLRGCIRVALKNKTMV